MANAPKPSPGGIDAKLIRELAGILNDTELTEIEVEQGELRIRVAREVTVSTQTMAYAAPAPMGAPAPAAAPAPIPAAPAAAAAPAPASGDRVPSPMVGTVYLQASPGADPFISVGATVKAGQTLLIVEAMKTMNPIASPRAGVIKEILVGDGQPVEFGEALVILE